MATPLVIQVAELGADDERTDEVTRMLRRHLEEVEGLEIRPLAGFPAPEGTRAPDIAVVGGLLACAVDLSSTIGPMVRAIREWLARTPEAPRSVRIQLGGDALELSNATAEQEAQLVELFVTRHTAR